MTDFINFIYSPAIQKIILDSNIKYEEVMLFIKKVIGPSIASLCIVKGINAFNELTIAQNSLFHKSTFEKSLKNKNHFIYFNIERENDIIRVYIPSNNDIEIIKKISNIKKLAVLI